MKTNFHKLLKYIPLGILAVVLLSCERKFDDLSPATTPVNPDVFIDGFSAGLNYASFGGAVPTAFDVDREVTYDNSAASMRFEVPDAGDPRGAYAGGAYFTESPRDLSGYDALTFWAKASQAATIDVVGFGNDMGASVYQVTINGLAVNTNWKKYIIPIPDASKLKAERGMFFYSEGPEEEKGYTFWIDELKFEKLGTLAHQQFTILNGEVKSETAFVGVAKPIDGLTAIFNLPTGINQAVNLTPAYFNFKTSNEAIAKVDESGVVTVVSGPGVAQITAQVGNVAATGQLNVQSAGQFAQAPVPQNDPTKVISIFSDAYTNVPVNYYNGYWAPYQTTLSADFEVNGDHILQYTNFNFVGIEFSAPTVNASSMSGLHLDIFIPNAMAGNAELKIELVNQGVEGSGAYTTSIPASQAQQWISLDVPFASFAGLAGRDKLMQIIFSNGDGNMPVFYADNIFFYGDGTPPPPGDEPSTAAPAPTANAADVIAIYSDAYTVLAGTDLNPNWGQATVVSEVQVQGNNTLKYLGLNYQGIALAGSENFSTMTTLHLDFWSANSSALNVYLISTGPVETAYALSVPTTGWASVDIPLSAFSPVDLTDVIQLKFDGGGDIYLDNIYFSKAGTPNPTEPSSPAPAPTANAADVIAVYSDAYSVLPGTDLNPNWGQATVVTEVQIQGNNTLKMAGLNYQGIALGGGQDITSMTSVHLDFWTANSTALNVFLISTGPVETPYTLTVPTSGWSSIDIPLSAFSPVDMSDVIQFKFDGDGDIYLDNIYFSKESGPAPTEPQTAAPTPTVNAADVIAIFSDAYTVVGGTDLNPNWGQTTVTSQVQVEGNNTYKMTGLNYQGIQFGSSQNVSGMAYLHIDFWTANSTAFQIYLISTGPVETPYTLTVPTSGWSSVDIPLTAFSPVNLSDAIQFKFEGNGTIYLDNLYFGK